MRAAIVSMIQAIAPLDEQEAAHRDDALAWIRSGVEIYRVVKPATPPKHLVSYCLLVDRATSQALLVDHRDAQRWLPAGGHVDVGENPGVAARRELHEELGVQPAFHSELGALPLMVTVTDTAGVSEPHTDVSLWFVFEGSCTTELNPDPGEFVDTRWWDFEDIRHGPHSRFDPHLPRFISKLTKLQKVR